MAGQKEEDVDTLKRRGRRRLVGAVALGLLAVVGLPMVFDPEPRRPAPPVSVRTPGEEDTAFAPKLTPKAAEKKPEAAKTAPAPAPEPKAEAPKPPEKKVEPKTEKKSAEA